MANAWIQHVKKTKDQYPELMQSGGLKAIIMKAKETYKKQTGGSGTPVGGTTESMNSEEVVGGRDSRVAPTDGAVVENSEPSNAHTMTAGGKKKGKKGKTAKKSKKSKKSKKGGKSKKRGKKNKSSKKSRKSRK
jgi:hypothetical protein